MTQITLTSDQTAQLAAATDEVVIADSDGKVIACVPKLSPEEAEIVAEAKRRLASDEPRIPFSEVVKKLNDRQAAEDGV